MRSLFVFLPIAGIVWMTGGLTVLRVGNPGGQAAHAVFSIISTFFFLIGLSYLPLADAIAIRSEEHTPELQSLMRTSHAVFCLKKKHTYNQQHTTTKSTM